MATVTPTVTEIGYRSFKVEWAGMATGDTITEHNAVGIISDATIQAEGTFGGSCEIGLTGSIDGSNFQALADLGGTAISAKATAFLAGIRENVTGFKPTIASGTSDSVTATITYKQEG